MLVGVTATWVGKSRFPRLNRLARNTCGPAIRRPLNQKNRTTASTRAAATPIARAAPPESKSESDICRTRKLLGKAGLRSLRSRPAVKPFQPRLLRTDANLMRSRAERLAESGRRAASLFQRGRFGSAPPSARVSGPQRRKLPHRKSDFVLSATRQRGGPSSDRRRIPGIQRGAAVGG